MHQKQVERFIFTYHSPPLSIYLFFSIILTFSPLYLSMFTYPSPPLSIYLFLPIIITFSPLYLSIFNYHFPPLSIFLSIILTFSFTFEISLFVSTTLTIFLFFF